LACAGTSQDGINVTAWSPTGRALSCPVHENEGVHVATFQPDETGEWSIAITHKGNHIQGGPFTCFVFDPNGVQLLDLEGALPGRTFSFVVDASSTGGLGDIAVDIVHDKQSVSHVIQESGHMKYRVSFVPCDHGKYRVYVYFNGSDVRGSPFSLRVGTQKSSRRSRESSQTNSLERSNISSLERRMNGLNSSQEPSPKAASSAIFKPSSPSSYTSTFKTFDKLNTSNQQHLPRSPNNHHHGLSGKNSHSPSMMNERKESFSGSYNQLHSRSPTWPPTNFHDETKDSYRSPSHSPMTFGNSTLQSSLNHSFGSNSKTSEQDYHSYLNRKGSADNGIVDTSSNVKGTSYSYLYICL
jgi:filamin